MQQPIDRVRYKTIPRTLIFLLHDDRVLLMRYGADKGPWAGKMNGLGGHIERGEDAYQAALREVREEIGLKPTDLRLCGTLLVDVEEDLGISVFVFVGGCTPDDVGPSHEGDPVWVRRGQIADQDVLEDVPPLLELALSSIESGTPFCTHSSEVQSQG